MANRTYVPHVALILRALRVSRERLEDDGKIAVDAKLLRALLQSALAATAFSAEFYCATYPDIAAAHQAGLIPDLHRHYLEAGYFEGRLGASPTIDEAFYLATYPDVAEAVQRGETASAAEHYIVSGAAEGRTPNPDLKPEVEAWLAVLRESHVR
jgi:hypothetical protein